MSSPLTSARVRLAATTVCLTLTTAVLAAPAESSTSEARTLRGDACNHTAPRPAYPRSASVRVGTFNIRAGVTTQTFAAGVKALLPYVDIVGLQEINSKDKARKLAAIKRTTNWDFWRQYRTNIPQHPNQGGAEQTPVLWRADRFVCTYSGPMLSIGRINMRGERPTWEGNQRHYFTVVHLVDRITGQRLSIVDVHMIPGAVKGGGPVPGRPRHWVVYRTQMTHLIQKVQNQEGYGRVLIMGDFNSGWVADMKHRHAYLPVRSFHNIGYTSMWATEHPRHRGTHRDALIDQVYADQRADRARVLFGLKGYSDHLPAVATYTLPAAS